MRTIDEIKAEIDNLKLILHKEKKCTSNCTYCDDEDKTYCGMLELEFELKDAVMEAINNRRCLILPCNVGDMVWFIKRGYDRKTYNGFYYIQEGYVKALKFSSRPTKITVEYPDSMNNGMSFCGADFNVTNIGKVLFLSKEQAEERLAEMNGGK